MKHSKRLKHYIRTTSFPIPHKYVLIQPSRDFGKTWLLNEFLKDYVNDSTSKQVIIVRYQSEGLMDYHRFVNHKAIYKRIYSRKLKRKLKKPRN